MSGCNLRNGRNGNDRGKYDSKPKPPMIRVHSYESMGTFDGPGLRLVVFLQGCNFRCLYCANPDTIETCGGTPTEASEILRMAVDQKPFYGRRGGVTFSGGEPTFQAAALVPLVRELKEAGIHVCLDSNGGVWNPAVEELLGLVDLVLLDVKQANPERHKGLTGRENAQTLRTAGAKTPRRSARRPGSKPTANLSGCATSSFRATATPKPICGCWANGSAATARSNASSCCPTTRSAFTSTRRWGWSTNCATYGRIRPSRSTGPRRCCGSIFRRWWSTDPLPRIARMRKPKKARTHVKSGPFVSIRPDDQKLVVNRIG